MKKITTIERIVQLAHDKKCVMFGKQRIPCAFIIGWPAGMLHAMVKAGRFTEYKKPKISK